jgi:hypothetical protein
MGAVIGTDAFFYADQFFSGAVGTCVNGNNGLDSDGDGVADCRDDCPDTTPAGTCLCPTVGRCCNCPELPLAICLATPSCFSEDVSPEACRQSHGIPECNGSPCRHGCLIGDANADGRRDLSDFRDLQNCFSASVGPIGYDAPSGECRFSFDADADGDIDAGRFRSG